MNLQKRRIPYKQWTGIVVGICLLAYGLSYFVRRHQAVMQRPLPSPSVTVTSSTAHPSEAPVSTKTPDYTVPADMPRLISLPSIGAEGFIQKIAIDKKTNEMAVPSNIHMAGWYTANAKPGDNGLSIIDGHVTGYYEPGIFQNLGQLTQGDAVYVEYGDGSRRNFAVVSVHAYAVADSAQHLFAQDASISSQLNLITCGGRYDKSQHQYDQRILVVTKRL